MTMHLKRSSGFSLIELMIAMLLGLVIVGGCISIFSGVIRSSALNQTVSNLQSNARFALDTIGRDIRAAGFLGCSAERNVGLNVTMTSPPTTDLAATGITGYVVTDSEWEPQSPTQYTAPLSVGKPVPGTHALSVQYAEYPGLELDTSMTSVSGSLVLQASDDPRLSDGQLMVISDCNSADLFSIESVSSTSTKVTLATGVSLQKRYSVSAGFSGATRAMPFVSTIYYVGDTQRNTEFGDDVYSLYAHNYPYTAANPPLELIEGVDQLVLEFGIRQANGNMLYTTAGTTNYMAEGVETVRVGMLLSSVNRISEVTSARAYTLAGQSVDAESAIADTPADETTGDSSGTAPSTATSETLTYPADKRLRIPFNATFNVRNRNN